MEGGAVRGSFPNSASVQNFVSLALHFQKSDDPGEKMSPPLARAGLIRMGPVTPE